MAQSESHMTQPSLIEQCCGQYSINKQGHSLTVTVPRSVQLAADSVIMRTGQYNDRLLYLKAMPVDAVLEGRSGTSPAADTDEVAEERIGVYSVRRKATDNLLTIPAKCDTSRYPEQSSPMIVHARSQQGLAYLKLIPERLYAHAETVSSPSLVAAEKTVSAPVS